MDLIEPIKYYARIFGGTLSRIAECEKLEEVKSETIDRKIKLLNRIINSHFIYLIGDDEKELVDWLNSKILDDLIKWMADYNINRRYLLFERVCCSGYLELAKIMVDANTFDGTIISTFRFVCREDKIEVAKWLIEKGVNPINEWAFRDACEFQHKEIVEWLISIGNNSIDDLAFARACKRCSLEFVKWMVGLGNNPKARHAFGEACLGRNLEVAKWLLEQGSVNFEPESYYLINKEDRDETVKWMTDNGLVGIFVKYPDQGRWTWNPYVE